MARLNGETPPTVAGWIVAAMVAVVAICAVTFMVTTQPLPPPAIARADSSDILRGPIGSPGPQIAADQARSDAAVRLAQQSADSAARDAQQTAQSAAASADQSAQNASAVEPAVPPPLPKDWDLRPGGASPQ